MALVTFMVGGVNKQSHIKVAESVRDLSDSEVEKEMVWDLGKNMG